MSQCPHCGRTLPRPDDRFCPYCGAAVAGDPGAPGPNPSGTTPWERRSQIGLVPALVETTTSVLFSPTRFFREMPVTGGIGAPLGYGVLLGYIGLVVQAIYQAVFRLAIGSALPRFGGRGDLERILPWLEGGLGLVFQIVLGPVLVVVGLFVGAGVYHLMLLLLGGARRDFEATFRVAAYGHAISVLVLLPFCGGLVAFVWWVAVGTVGLSEVHGIGRGKALAAILLPVLVVCCCCAGTIALVVGGAASLAGLAR